MARQAFLPSALSRCGTEFVTKRTIGTGILSTGLQQGGQGLGRFFEELKRRNVFRVAIAYLIATWLVLQVADIVLEIIGAPDWVAQVFLLVFALGFPLALIFSWAYELTPEGVKREKDVDRERSITSTTGRKLNLVTIGMLIAVLAVVGFERAFFSQPVTEVAKQGIQMDPHSIAVLAFEDMSPDGDQAYFADGLSEELLNVLAQVRDLKVAGRTSSFAFRGQNKNLQEIGELLNVSHILEGSVRKSGNRIRVTAQLVKASDGFHLYSDTYERELSDIFEVQDEIARSISSALLSEIIGAEVIGHATPTDPEAYELYLMARQRINSRDPTAMHEASVMLDRALEIDPIYAPALAQKALVTYLTSDRLGAYGDTPYQEALPIAQRFVEQALALDDGLAEAHAVNGLLLDDQYKYEEAIAALRHAIELNPTMSDAANWLSNALVSISRRQESQAILEEIVKRDPTYGPAFSNLTVLYMRHADFDRADALITRVARIVGENDNTLQARGMASFMRGNAAEGTRYLQRAYDENRSSTVVKMWYGFALQSTAEYEKLAEVGLPEHRMIALRAQGLRNDARDVMEALDLTSGSVQRVLSNVGDMLIRDGLSQEFIDLVHDQYGSTEALLRDYPVDRTWGAGYAGYLAYAYLQTGDEKMFRELLQAMHDALDVQREQGSDNFVHIYGRAQYAALSGDADEAISSLRTALDMGFSWAGSFDTPIFDGLKGEPRFDEVVQSLANRVDEQRAILGMPPYRPFPETEKRKSRPSY